MNATLITPENRADWLARRRETLGASESPAALGLSPWTSPRGLYLAKLGMLPDAPPSLAMRVGLALEPLVAELYREATGKAIRDQQRWVRGEGGRAFLSATLDGWTDADAGHPVEFKAIGDRKAGDVGDEGTDELPDHWLVQAHQQMALTGTDRVDFAVLVGNSNFKVLTVRFDAGLWDAAFGRLAAFWGCVARRVPPPECHPGDAGIMHLLYPDAGPGVELTEEDQAHVKYWEDSRVDAHAAKEGIQDARTRLLERLGDAAWGRLPDGRLLTRKVIDVKERTQTVKAYSYADLRVKAPRED